MCRECYQWDDDYVDPEWVLYEALWEIADQHQAIWTQSRLADGKALCDDCGQWWPCVTFMVAVNGINDAR